jgi:predicted Rossmann fold nucleotide-binding protein DprA/Smf involved in DNA uptake
VELLGKTQMILAIVGSRKYKNRDRIEKVVNFYIKNYGEITIVSGGCPDGGDFLAKDIALSLKIKYHEFPPIHFKHNEYCVSSEDQYDKSYHVSNFFNRNTQIAKHCDHLIAFVIKNVKSNGTMDTVTKARKFGKKVTVFED